MNNELRRERNVQVDGVLLTLFVAIAVLLSAVIIKTTAVHLEKKRNVKSDSKITEIEEEPFKREVKNKEYIAPDSDDNEEEEIEKPETIESTNKEQPRKGGNIGVDQNTTHIPPKEESEKTPKEESEPTSEEESEKTPKDETTSIPEEVEEPKPETEPNPESDQNQNPSIE